MCVCVCVCVCVVMTQLHFSEICVFVFFQLMQSPAPFVIGVPASFFHLQRKVTQPNDVWLVDLDNQTVCVTVLSSFVSTYTANPYPPRQIHIRVKFK